MARGSKSGGGRFARWGRNGRGRTRRPNGNGLASKCSRGTSRRGRPPSMLGTGPFANRKASWNAAARNCDECGSRSRNSSSSLSTQRLRGRPVRRPSRPTVGVEEEEGAPEQRDEDEGAQDVVQSEGDLCLEHHRERHAERTGQKIPFAEGGPQIIADRDRNADRREEGDGLHPKQDLRPDAATEETHEHVPRHYEERDPSHRPDRVAPIGRPPFQRLEDRHRGQRHEDRPPPPQEGPGQQASDEDRLDVRERVHQVRPEDGDENEEDSEDPGPGVAKALVRPCPPPRHPQPPSLGLEKVHWTISPSWRPWWSAATVP